MRRAAITIFAALLAGLAAAAPSAAGPSPAAPALKPGRMFAATGGYTYFNRPGADLATHDSELKNCVETSNAGYRLNPAEATPLTGGGILDYSFAGSAVVAGEKVRRGANVENCMVVRGWRVVLLPQREGERLSVKPHDELVRIVSPWIGAETPHGEVVRTFGNEVLRGDARINGDVPGLHGAMISILVADPAAPAPPRQAASLLRPGGPQAFRVNMATPVSVAAGWTPPPGKAVLVVRIQGARRNPMYGFGLDRETAEPIGPGEGADLIGVVLLRDRHDRAEPVDRTEVYVVPAGRYRVHSRGRIDFCLGGPSVEIAAGEVVYLGGFSFLPETTAIDMDLGPARAALAPNPDLSARLKPAAWVNGHTWTCQGWLSYAMEFPGFPYEQGYAWGGASGGN